MNTLTVAATAVVTVFYLLYRYAYSTNTPKIKGLPEVPGLPFLGSLLAIGDCHARKALEWSKTYGPVFQVRLGSRRVGTSSSVIQTHMSCLTSRFTSFRQHLPIRLPPLDNPTVCPDLPARTLHLPQRRLLLARLHHRHLPLERIRQAPTQSGSNRSQPSQRRFVHAHHRPRIRRLYSRVVRRYTLWPSRHRSFSLLPTLCAQHVFNSQLRF